MILVTGAAGHIGNVLVRELLTRGKPVRAMLLPGEDRTPLNGLNVEIVEANVLNLPQLTNAFEGVDTVFHLAGLISILPGKDEMVNLVNVEGTRNVIQAARMMGVRRLVYTSSIHALTRLPDDQVIDESTPFDPENSAGEYDRSKAQASLEVLSAARDGLDAVVVCPTGVIGPYDFRLSEMGTLIKDWMANKPSWLIDGAYDFVDVRDVVNGMIAASERGQTGESYILSGEKISIKNLMLIVKELLHLKARPLVVPVWLARIAAEFTPFVYRLTHTKPRFTRYSIITVTGGSNISHAKAARDLNYQPRSLRHSLADTVTWFYENRPLFQHNRKK